jgi:hypothetical protein
MFPGGAWRSTPAHGPEGALQQLGAFARHAASVDQLPLREMPEAIELTMTISERGKAKPTCPACKGTKVIPQLGGFMGQTAKKS